MIVSSPLLASAIFKSLPTSLVRRPSILIQCLSLNTYDLKEKPKLVTTEKHSYVVLDTMFCLLSYRSTISCRLYSLSSRVSELIASSKSATTLSKYEISSSWPLVPSMIDSRSCISRPNLSMVFYSRWESTSFGSI